MLSNLLRIPVASDAEAAAEPAAETDVDPIAAIDTALSELRTIEDQLADLTSRKKALRTAVYEQADFGIDDSMTRPMAVLKLMPAHERISYDRRGLDAVAASSPELAEILSPHRREKTIGPSLRIQWRKD